MSQILKTHTSLSDEMKISFSNGWIVGADRFGDGKYYPILSKQRVVWSGDKGFFDRDSCKSFIQDNRDALPNRYDPVHIDKLGDKFDIELITGTIRWSPADRIFNDVFQALHFIHTNGLPVTE